MNVRNQEQQQPQEQAQQLAKHGVGAVEYQGDREAAFKRIWRDTHRDYRGRLADGTLTLLSYAKFGGGLVSPATITDSELAERLQAVRQ